MASSTMIMHSNINLFVAILKEKKKSRIDGRMSNSIEWKCWVCLARAFMRYKFLCINNA